MRRRCGKCRAGWDFCRIRRGRRSSTRSCRRGFGVSGHRSASGRSAHRFVVGMDRGGELIGGEPGDEAAVVVVQWIVPAVGAGRQLGRIVVVGFSIDDFFAALLGQLAEGDALVTLAEKSADKVADKRPAAERARGEADALDLITLLGEPVFDLFAAVVAGLLRGGRTIQPRRTAATIGFYRWCPASSDT